jgi:hypothetical protein
MFCGQCGSNIAQLSDSFDGRIAIRESDRPDIGVILFLPQPVVRTARWIGNVRRPDLDGLTISESGNFDDLRRLPVSGEIYQQNRYEAITVGPVVDV